MALKNAGSRAIHNINYNYYLLLSMGNEDSGSDGQKAAMRAIMFPHIGRIWLLAARV
jgi:hypothetical protein